MARTAPAPNIPPIPGMCPGMVVLAGGGDGGGGSGGGGKSGKGKKGAGAKKGKKDPKGDKKGAKGNNGDAKCGKGSKSGCGGCSKKGKAGDPVDVASGEVFVEPVTDLFLPGPFDLDFRRAYSSSADVRAVDMGMGFGWTHSFAWRLEIRGRRVVVCDGVGARVEFALPAVGEANAAAGWVLWRESWGFRVDCGTDFWHSFMPLAENARRHVLAAVDGPNGNRVLLRHDERGWLREATDSAGRTIAFHIDGNGRLTSISVPEPTTGASLEFARYTYDAKGDLVTVTDADGNTTRFTYDDDHLILQQRHPTGLTFHWVYDHQRRCIETWGDYPEGHDPALAADVPKMLANGTTRAKGIHHVRLDFFPDDSVEVANSVQVQRFHNDENGAALLVASNGGVTTRRFDGDGNVVALTDRNGFTTTYEYDGRGRLLAETDPLGRTVRFVRDTNGRTVETIDAAGGSVKATRDSRGNVQMIVNQVGAVTSYRYDERGLLTEQVGPNGARWAYTTDAHGNLTEALLPNGARWRYRYDFWGRGVERTDPLGNVTKYGYSNAGRLVSVTERDGTTVHAEHDGLGSVVATTDGQGRVTRYEWGGYGWLVAEVQPNGDWVEGRYNREGWLVGVRNERGEWATSTLNANAQPMERRGFAGELRRYRYDAMGRLTSYQDPDGRRFEYVLDPCGNVLERSFADGTSESYEYDRRREMIVARGPFAEVSLERDAAGFIVRETVKSGEQQTVVVSELDPMGRRKSSRATGGDPLRFSRDGDGLVRRIDLDSTRSIRFDRNLFGAVTRETLPGGATIESEFDIVTRLSRRLVVPRLAEENSHGEVQPEWVGARSSSALEKAFQYTPNHQVASRWDSDLGQTRYEYDLRDRLTARITENAATDEQFTHDADGNLHEVGPGAPPRAYAAGDVLLRRGGTTYVFDRSGFLVSKQGAADDRPWSYEWAGDGWLSAVVRPDGARVEFEYDPFERRTKKTVYELRDGALAWLATTRFEWDLMTMVREETTSRTEAGETVRLVRRYLYVENDDALPIAHCDERVNGDGTIVRGDWYHYVGDVLDVPEQIVAGDGRLVARLTRSAYGVTAVEGAGQTTTPFRMQGQYADRETGLVYNRYRYYDPELGRYISADPTTFGGGTNFFAYCHNPIAWSDPLGLHDMTFNVTGPGGKPDVTPKHNDGTSASPLYSGWGEDKNKPGKHLCPDDLKNRANCHTEQKALKMMEDKKTLAELNRGGKASLGGQYPPCKVCHGKMSAWAEKNLKKGGSIEYAYPTNNSVTYTGKGATPSAGNASALVAGYGGKGPDVYAAQRDANKKLLGL